MRRPCAVNQLQRILPQIFLGTITRPFLYNRRQYWALMSTCPYRYVRYNFIRIILRSVNDQLMKIENICEQYVGFGIFWFKFIRCKPGRARPSILKPSRVLHTALLAGV